MKKLILGAILACVVGLITLSASNANQPNQPEMELNATNDGMYFSTLGVVDNFWYGDVENGAYYVIYDDMDSGMNYEAIRVTRDTYNAILGAMENEVEINGTLKAVKEFETVEYELEY